MLRCRWVLGNVSLRRANSTSAATATSRAVSIEKTAEPQLRNIYEFIEKTSIGNICRPSSPAVVKLAGLLESIEGGHDMRKVRNKLTRRFGTGYSALYPCLRNVGSDPLKLEMSMYRKVGLRQQSAFIKNLSYNIIREDLTTDQKKQKLYDIIKFQHDLFPEAHKKGVIMLPNHIHKWFWEVVPKNESFNHFYFMIKNDVYLSSSEYIWKFATRLMQGSEMEVQLATFQIFLHQDSHQAMFYSKFSKLYSFSAMILILKKVLNLKDFRFVKIFLSALLHKMEAHEMQRNGLSAEAKQLLFVKFNNTLLYYLSQTGNVDMFLQAFAIELQYMQKNGLLKDPKRASKFLHKPLHFVLKLLRTKGHHEEFFKLISIIQQPTVTKNYEFNNRVLSELISSLRSFNDPKLTCQYIMSGFKRYPTGELLNNLGIWGAVFHESPRILTKIVLQEEIQALAVLLPKSMKVYGMPSLAVLTELYRVVLSTNASIMSNEQYQVLILELYSNYTNALKAEQSKFRSWKHDTGILNVFLHHIRFVLGNFQLAYEILKDFHTQKFDIDIRNTSPICPFSLVVYKNNEISQEEVTHLLTLMHEHKIPLQFRLCTAMVLRYLKLNNPDEAYAWYEKILHAGFNVKHSLLIKAIRANAWEYPKNFDMSLLAKIDDTSSVDSNEDILFLEGNDEFTNLDSEQEGSNNEKSLSEIIDLVKYIT